MNGVAAEEKRAMKGNRVAGITLIEIMIAVAIMSIIAAIAIPLYRDYIDEGRIGSTITSIRQAQLFFDDLAMDMNLAAADAGDGTVRGLYMLSGRPVLGDVGSPPAGADAWIDPWGQTLRYQRPAQRNIGGGVSNDSTNPQGYDLFSIGEDGVAGNGDDIMRGCNGAYVGLASTHPAGC